MGRDHFSVPRDCRGWMVMVVAEGSLRAFADKWGGLDATVSTKGFSPCDMKRKSGVLLKI